MKKKIISVSVIIPCYKSSETIERAVESIVNQTVHPSEIIIVDDFSEDKKTYNTLKNIKNRYNFVNLIFLKENVGPGSARNRGWEIATSNYIAFLDSDDAWHPKKLEIQYNFMESNNEIGLSGHKSMVFNGFHNIIDEDKNTKIVSFRKIDFLIKNRIATRTVMLKANLPYRFLENKRASEDFLLWSEMYLNRINIVSIEESLSYSFKNAFGESGLTGNLLNMQKGELDTYKKLLEKKLINNNLYLVLKTFSLIKYYRRKLIIKIR